MNVSDAYWLGVDEARRGWLPCAVSDDPELNDAYLLGYEIEQSENFTTA